MDCDWSSRPALPSIIVQHAPPCRFRRQTILQLRQADEARCSTFLVTLRGVWRLKQQRSRFRSFRKWKFVVALGDRRTGENDKEKRAAEFRHAWLQRCWVILSQTFRRNTLRTSRFFSRWLVETRTSSRERALLKEVGNLRELNHAFKRQLLMRLSEESGDSDLPASDSGSVGSRGGGSGTSGGSRAGGSKRPPRPHYPPPAIGGRSSRASR